jgi:hypothetical protein
MHAVAQHDEHNANEKGPDPDNTLIMSHLSVSGGLAQNTVQFLHCCFCCSAVCVQVYDKEQLRTLCHQRAPIVEIHMAIDLATGDQSRPHHLGASYRLPAKEKGPNPLLLNP